MSVVMLMDMREFRQQQAQFLREMSHVLRTTVRVKKDADGNDMIFTWKGTSPMSDIQDSEFGRKHKILYTQRDGQTGIQIYLEIDNRKCTECFNRATEAAEFLAASAAKHTFTNRYPIYSVRGVRSPGESGDDFESPANVKYVITGIILVIQV